MPFWLITLANIALFIAAVGLSGWTLASIHVNPMLGPPQNSLLLVGALDAGRIIQHGQWWRLLSSPFVNAGV